MPTQVKLPPRIVWTVIPQGYFNRGVGRLAIVIAPQLQANGLDGTVLEDWPTCLQAFLGSLTLDLFNGREMPLRCDGPRPSSAWWRALFAKDLRMSDPGGEVTETRTVGEFHAADALVKSRTTNAPLDGHLLNLAKNARGGSISDAAEFADAVLDSSRRVNEALKPYTGHTEVTHLIKERKVTGNWCSDGVPSPNGDCTGLEPEEFAVVLHRYSQYPVLMRALGLILDCRVDLPAATSFEHIALSGLKLGGNAISMTTRTAVDWSRFIPQPVAREFDFRTSDKENRRVWVIREDFGRVDPTSGLVRLSGGLALSANLQGAGSRELAYSEIVCTPSEADTQVLETKVLPPSSDRLLAKGFQGDGVAILAPSSLDAEHLPFLLWRAGQEAEVAELIASTFQSTGPNTVLDGPIDPRTGRIAGLGMDDLIVGWRVDVRSMGPDGMATKWMSLCDRKLKYDAHQPGMTLRDPDDNHPLRKVREGWVGFSSMIHDGGKNNPVRSFSDILFRWSGWSLVASPPWLEAEKDSVDNARETCPEHPEKEGVKAEKHMQLLTTDELKKRQLPKLRWRTTDANGEANVGVVYEFRARAVDLAGLDVNEYGRAFSQEHLQDCVVPHLHLRLDAIPAPRCLKTDDQSVVRKGDAISTHRLAPKEGESEHAVVKLPLATFERVVFDGRIDGLKPDDAYALLCRLSLDGSEQERPVLNTVEVDPLTDPATDQIVWEAFEGPFAQDKLDGGAFAFAEWPIGDGRGWNLKVTRIEPPEGREAAVDAWEKGTIPKRSALIGINEFKDQIVYDADMRPIEFKVAAHWPLILQLNAMPTAAHGLLAPGVFGSDEEIQKKAFRKGLVLACPSLRPVFNPRNLTISHAQSSLGTPRVPDDSGTLPFAMRPENHTVLSGLCKVVLHVPSTGWCELEGLVYERSDITELDVEVNLGKPIPSTGTLSARLSDFTKHDPITDLADILSTAHVPFQLDILTTKRVRIEFKLEAGSAYSADFEKTEKSTAVNCQVVLPATARPLKPVIADMLPTYKRTTADALNEKVTRYFTGLRLYLARPWFSSGEGEELAVLVNPRDAKDDNCTRWGNDAIQLEKTPGDNSSIKVEGRKLTRGNADLYLYRPTFDKILDRWFVDLDLTIAGSYFPFIQLRLARYQPYAVGEPDIYQDGQVPPRIPALGLSEIEDCPPIQLPPEREFRASKTGGKVRIDVLGSWPASNRFKVFAAAEDELARLGSMIYEGLPVQSFVPAKSFQARTTLELDTQVAQVIIQEFEHVFYNDSESDARVVGSYLVDL